MIPYAAVAARQAAVRAQLGRAPPTGHAVIQPPIAHDLRVEPAPEPAAPPPPRLTRDQFLAREVRSLVLTILTADRLGVMRWGVRYVAVACAGQHEHNPGWALVRDDPFALAHFQRLFGGPHAPAASTTPARHA